jgi:hypothetical protein
MWQILFAAPTPARSWPLISPLQVITPHRRVMGWWMAVDGGGRAVDGWWRTCNLNRQVMVPPPPHLVPPPPHLVPPPSVPPPSRRMSPESAGLAASSGSPSAGPRRPAFAGRIYEGMAPFQPASTSAACCFCTPRPTSCGIYRI